MTGKPNPKTAAQLPIIRGTTKCIQATSAKRQMGQKLWRKIWRSAQKTFLFVLWRRKRAYNKNVSGYNPKAERDCRSRSPVESAEAGPTYRFMLLSVCPRVCRQSTAYDLCRFGKPFSSFLGPVSTTTASTYSGPQSTARRASPRSTTARFSGGVRSSHSQQYCAQVEAHLLQDILI
jgi:hypothetical protein